MTPKSPVIATLPPAKSTWNVVSVPSETVKSLLTTKVPPITVLPVADATVNLLVFISKSPSIPVAPVTSNVPPNVVLPVTPNVPPNAVLPPTFNAPPIPAPPTNCKAPDVVFVEFSLENILVFPQILTFLPTASPPAICTAPLKILVVQLIAVGSESVTSLNFAFCPLSSDSRMNFLAGFANLTSLLNVTGPSN